MSQIPQLTPIERNLPKSEADWTRLFGQFLQWRRTIQGMSWQPITLLNGWAAYSASYAPPQYYVDAAGRLFCRGLIAGGTVADGTSIFVVPYTPSYRVVTVQQGNSGSGYVQARVDVLTTGSVVVYDVSSFSTGNFLSLDQLSFSLIQ
jgi:hypothetical protein